MALKFTSIAFAAATLVACTLHAQFVGPTQSEEAVTSSQDELLARVLEELSQLRATVSRLEATVDEITQTLIRDLEDENRRLRRALGLRYGGGESGLPDVPMPDRDLLERVLRERMTSQAPSTPEATLGNEPFTIIREWGRSPDLVAAIGGGARSLKGAVLAIPRRPSDGELAQLGREIREQYPGYDNLNIDVFVGEAAAQDYLDDGGAHGPDHVLTISRHKDSGADTILIVRGNQTEEVPLSP